MINPTPTIQHIAFIMDGNRRWAKEHKLPTLVGHSKGYRRIEHIVKHVLKLDIPYVTFWAFSTENWNRDKEEVDYLMGLFRKLFQLKSLEKIIKEGARIVVLGNLSRFPVDIQKNALEIIEKTKKNKKITVNIALNYGGREEIVFAVNKILQEKKQSITIEEFGKYLYTSGQPDPDLIIRTGGDQRLSGYLPWQGIYSELCFIPTYWPDFNGKQLDQILVDYSHRQRRFGI